MLKVVWSEHAAADLERIFSYWEERDLELAVAIVQTIDRRIHWLADDRFSIGVIVPGLSPSHRYYLERRYSYKIYYQIQGDPADALQVLRIRHARQRPLSSTEIQEPPSQRPG